MAKTTKRAASRRKPSQRKDKKRELLDTGKDKRYVRREAGGRFHESDQGRSLAADRRRKAKKVVKAGQGDLGDRKRR